ncbi:MAG: metallophosphoesterase [Clostridia bacterium]|nr:metallophosphoesterase [Clostridia bacterium]
MFYVLFALVFLLPIPGAVYIAKHFYRTKPLQRLKQNHKKLAIAASLLPIVVCLLFAFVNITTAAIILFHLIVLLLLCDLIALIFRKCTKKAVSPDVIWIVATVLTAVLLVWGNLTARNIHATHYTVETEKPIGTPFRVALISDTHIGVTLNAENFPKLLERIVAEKPDVLLIGGDFIDESSPWPDTEAACTALGKLDIPYGVWFVYGNHDGGSFRNRQERKEQLTRLLEQNGIGILEDSSTELRDGLVLIGRADKSAKTRLPIEALMQDIVPEAYTIVLDHQPNDFNAEAAAGADLVLCGHTHGGQIFPAGPIGMIAGMNDLLYGTEKRGNTTFIVSSGAAAWSIPFRTGSKSEYVIVDIDPK